MTESASADAPSQSILVFEKPRSALGWIVPVGIFLAGVVFAESPESSGTSSGGIVTACFLLASVFGLISSRRWIAEIDLNTRTFRLTKLSFGRWKRRVVDCPLDQCMRLGRIEYETEGSLSYGVYVELANGRRHAIPLRESTLAEAGRVAAQLAETTGIPRLDTKY
jgi:hypothetical protein